MLRDDVVIADAIVATVYFQRFQPIFTQKCLYEGFLVDFLDKKFQPMHRNDPYEVRSGI